MRKVMRLVCGVAVPLLVAGPLSAQRGAIELGMDAIFAWHNLDGVDDNLFEIGGPIGGFTTLAPVQGLRAGFFLNDMVSVEPSLGFSLLSTGDDSLNRLALSLTGLVFTSRDAVRSRPFLGVGGSFSNLGVSDEPSVQQFGVHALAGMKVPVVEKVAFRFAAGGARFFESDEMEARWTVFGTLGLSYTIGGPMKVASR